MDNIFVNLMNHLGIETYVWGPGMYDRVIRGMDDDGVGSWVPVEAHSDKEFILMALERTGVFIGWNEEEFANDKAFISALVKLDGSLLSEASPTLRADTDVVFAAIMQECRGLIHPKQSTTSPNLEHIKYAEPGILDNKEFMLKLLETGVIPPSELLLYTGDDLRNDETFLEVLVINDPYSLVHIDDHIKNTPEFILRTFEGCNDDFSVSDIFLDNMGDDLASDDHFLELIDTSTVSDLI